MPYHFATEKINYEDYAAGRVLLNRPGATSFPVRLASEIFQHCAAYLRERGKTGPYRIYDPCCGTGYLVTVLGFLHGDQIGVIFASDIDAEVVALARQNLALLNPADLDARSAQLEDLLKRFGKTSHRDALASAQRLKPQPAIETACFVADATETALPIENVDLLITDVPYGRAAQWSGTGEIEQLLAAQRSTLAAVSVAALVSDKTQNVTHRAYRRLKRFSIGKRRITLMVEYR